MKQSNKLSRLLKLLTIFCVITSFTISALANQSQSPTPCDRLLTKCAIVVREQKEAITALQKERAARESLITEQSKQLKEAKREVKKAKKQGLSVLGLALLLVIL